MNDKLIGIIIGAALTLGVVGIVGNLTLAHADDSIESNYGMHGSMMGHGMHHGMMSGMSLEEMEGDGDGACDVCGMPVEECLEMMDSGGMMNCPMMR